MIPALLQIVVVVIAGILGGFFEGKADAKRALENKPVEHKWSATIRFWIACFALGIMSGTFGTPWYLSLVLLVVAFGSFSPMFRLTMNKRRKLDWRYVSPSNWYDDQFIKMTWFYGMTVWITSRVFFHKECYNSNPDYTKAVHSAGLYMYAFEFSCLTLSSILFVVGVILNNN